MTVRYASLPELPGILPDLVGIASVIALVPTGDAGAHAPDAAWAVARAAAALGRRTLLVDCFVDAPCLHAVVGSTHDDGIVDAFEYGASLNRIAREQPEENLYFIPTGTYAADPVALMANRRWQRLAAGFRHEGALLCLYLPAAALPVIAREAEGAIVFALPGFDAARDAAPEVATLAESGTPVVVVTEAGARAAEGPGATAEVAAAPEAQPARPVLRRARPPFAELAAVREGTQRTRRAVVYAGVVVLAGVLAVIAVRPDWILPADDTADERAAPVAARPAQAPDSLPWVVQVSAWNDLRRAMEAADTLEARGVRALVTPTRLPRRVSFRVQAGPFATQAAADSLVDTLRARGLADPIGSMSVRLPLSLALGSAPSAGSARAQRDSLRAQGVPAFVLRQPGDRFRLLAGAFEDTTAATYLDSLLSTLGRARRLGSRVGLVP